MRRNKKSWSGRTEMDETAADDSQAARRDIFADQFLFEDFVQTL